MKKLHQEHVIGICCLLISTVVLFLTRSFPKGQSNINITGPAFFPNLLAIVFILCGMYEIAIGFFQKDGHIHLNGKSIKAALKEAQTINVIFIIGLLLFFILFFEKIGFVICAFLFVFLLMARLKVPLMKNLLYTIMFILVILLIFGKLFSISFPSGLLEYVGL